MEKQNYLNTIKVAGFKNITIVSEKPFIEPNMDNRLVGRVISIQVKAYK